MKWEKCFLSCYVILIIWWLWHIVWLRICHQVSHEFPFNFDKRNLDSLARNGQLPYYKRSLASLAKSGQLPEKLAQEKRMLDVLEEANDANSKAIHEQRSRVVQVIINVSFILVLQRRLGMDSILINYSSTSWQVSRRIKQFFFQFRLIFIRWYGTSK